jgi:hypothetical protein
VPNRLASLPSATVLPHIDVSLYGLVHEILEVERARDVAERRDGRRHPYCCFQLIAPMWEDRLPAASQFRLVQCVDLSAAGLLYLDHESPATPKLVVALGTDNPIRLIAEVVREEIVVVDRQRVHRVACRFTGRAVER